MSASRILKYSIAIGLLLRAGLVALSVIEPSLNATGDQAVFQSVAGELSRQWNFGAWFGVERMPLYPTFLAMCNMLTGLQVDGAELPARTQVVALLMQALFGLLAVYVLYRAGALFSRTVGMLAAVFAVLNVNAGLFGARLQDDALVFPVMALALYVFLLYRRTGGGVRLAALAAILGLGTLTSPVLMYIPLAVVPFLMVEWRSGGLGARLARCLMFCLVFGVFLLPWLGRNLYYFGHAGLYGLGETNVVERIVPGVLQASDDISLGEARDKARRLWLERLAEGRGGASGSADAAEGLGKEAVADGTAVPSGVLPGGPLEDAPVMAALVRGFLWDVLGQAGPMAVAEAWGSGAVRTLFAPAVSVLPTLYGLEHRPLAMTQGDSFLNRIGTYVSHNATGWLPALIAVGALVTGVVRLVQLAGLGVLARRRPGNMVAVLFLVAYVLIVGGPAGNASLRLCLEPALAMLAARGVAAFSLLGIDAPEEGAT